MLLAGLENSPVAIENNHNTQISRPWKSEVYWMLLIAPRAACCKATAKMSLKKLCAFSVCASSD
jgi:hypothetical protein